MARTEDIKLRQHLNADALIKTMHTGFTGIRDHRTGTVTHTLADSLMAGLMWLHYPEHTNTGIMPDNAGVSKRRHKYGWFPPDLHIVGQKPHYTVWFCAEFTADGTKINFRPIFGSNRE